MEAARAEQAAAHEAAVERLRDLAHADEVSPKVNTDDEPQDAADHGH
jgi:hypothetical protein